MKHLIEQILNKVDSTQHKRLLLTEFLQHLVLQSLYRHDSFKYLVFTGGTALRLLYHTNRFSEDLFFSLAHPTGFQFRATLDKIHKDLTSQQLPFEFFPSEVKTVDKADLRFPGLLKEFQLSPMQSQKLTIKLEIDTNPPQGGKVETALVTEPVSYTAAVFDLPSLFATKLHAIFFRSYTKGRDYYDLFWYLGKKVVPNFTLLNNAIRQTQGAGHEIHPETFKEKLTQNLEKADFKKIRSDVERFIMNRSELEFLHLEPIKSLLRQYELPH